MRVLLVQSYLGPSEEMLTYPLGLAYIATAAHLQGHELRIIDPNARPDPEGALCRAVSDFRPQCIGVSLRNIDSQNRLHPVYYYKHFQRMLAVIRDAQPDVPLVVGGSGFSMFARQIMERNHSIDFGVYLEAEETFPELLRKLDDPSEVKGVFCRRDGEVVFSGERPLPDFQAAPYPRREFVDMAPYLRVPQSIGVQTKRGCPLRCAYCNYPHLNGTEHRLRSAKHVADELEYLVERFGVKEIAFADSVLNVPADHGEAVFEEIIRRRIRITWGAYMHLKGISTEYLRLAQRAGCTSVLFSPDGISQPALDALQKDLAGQDVQGVFRLLSNNREFRGLHVGFSYFICPPGETPGGLLDALWFYIRVQLSRLKRGTARMRAYVGWIRLEPDTAVYERAVREGSVAKDQDLLPDEARELTRVFYRHPRLGWVDPLLLAAFRLIRIAETTVRCALRRRRTRE